MNIFKINTRAVRAQQGPPLAAYPPTVRRILFWFDSLSDLQRVQYACVAILFLLACGGYLLGLGSTIVLARVESDQAALAAEALPTLETMPTDVPVLPPDAPTATPRPSPTPLAPTEVPSVRPFTAPVIAEPPAAPRVLPAEQPVVIAPSAPRATPTSKPRNVETSKPEAPAASVRTPTPGLLRSAPPATATPAHQEPTSATTRRSATPAPTVAATTPPVHSIAATAAPTRAVSAPAGPTAVRTPTPAR